MVWGELFVDLAELLFDFFTLMVLFIEHDLNLSFPSNLHFTLYFPVLFIKIFPCPFTLVLISFLMVFPSFLLSVTCIVSLEIPFPFKSLKDTFR